MLLVQTLAKPSEIHGIGVFADERIPKGTVVWKFDPVFDLVFSPEEFERLGELQRNLIRHYGYLSTASGKWIFVTDDYRFANHSIKNNINSIPIVGAEFCDVAGRDIDIGEELTLNYQTFDARYVDGDKAFLKYQELTTAAITFGPTSF